MTTTEFSHDDLPCEELLLPALSILESLDEGHTQCKTGTCRLCRQRRGVIHERQLRRKPYGYCVDCLIGILLTKHQDRTSS